MEKLSSSSSVRQDFPPSKVFRLTHHSARRVIPTLALLTLSLCVVYTTQHAEATWLKISAIFGYSLPPIPSQTAHLWGYLAPYRDIGPYRKPPSDCVIDQVNILHRHGARFPQSSDQKSTMDAVDKYQKANTYHARELQFLNRYSYNLGSESLVQFGAEQSWMSGALAYQRYTNLVDQDHLPFIRASLSDRVVMSASNWTHGFYKASGHLYEPKVSVYMDESPHSNNTLECNNCPNASKPHKQVNTWTEIYASSIAERLNSMAEGLPENVTAKDAFYLMMMCPLESQYLGKESNFCRMFTKAEFRGFEYALDLEQFYNTGYGQEDNLGRIQGVGYVNELLARLTNRPVEDQTRINRTLDSDAKTFPLGKKMYVDFSHDHAMVAIFSALGLFDGKPLSPSKLQPDREWIASDIMPFSSRMSVERLRCSLARPFRPYGLRIQGARKKTREGEYLRILVNDGVQPLPFCGSDKDGLCHLADFVASQKFSRTNGEGKFYKCGYNPSAL